MSTATATPDNQTGATPGADGQEQQEEPIHSAMEDIDRDFGMLNK